MNIPALTDKMIKETEKIIIGKTDKIKLIIMAFLSEGHVLLDDLPGVGKTTLAKTLSLVLGCNTRRIQFVPDLLPADIIGMNIYNQKSCDFQFLPGPIFTNILLADEINRAVPRTQSALLEAMEEHQVTVDGSTINLTSPFIVMATQNPVESDSTFRLPAAQMDRFLIKLSMGYPAPEEETRMLFSLGNKIPLDDVETVTNPEEITSIQKEIYNIKMSNSVASYIVNIVSSTRSNSSTKVGASPRASRALYKASKAWAAMNGRSFVTPDDVQEIAVPVLAHRLLLTNEARLSGISAESIIEEILGELAVPPENGEVFDE